MISCRCDCIDCGNAGILFRRWSETRQEKKELIGDLTVGRVTETLTAFAVPLFLFRLLQIVCGIADMIFAGRLFLFGKMEGVGSRV